MPNSTPAERLQEKKDQRRTDRRQELGLEEKKEK
jgi:hypothetical protein